MDYEDIIAANYVDVIGTDKNFFKVLPDDIGELKYCRSTNPKAEKDSPEKRRKQSAMAIGIPVAVTILLGVLCHNSPIFVGIVGVIAFIIIIYCLRKISTFKGEDFFVGSEGYARVEFDGSREDAKIIEKVRFEDCADFISKEVVHKRNGQYDFTEIEKYFYSDLNENGQRKCIGGWEGNIDRTSDAYKFMKDVESSWSVFLFDRIKRKYADGNPVSFNVYTGDGFINDYFIFEGASLKVGARMYDKSTLKDVRIGNGVLVIEHMNHSSELFGLIKKGDQEEIPFSMIANSKVFMLFFEDFVAKTLK